MKIFVLIFLIGITTRISGQDHGFGLGLLVGEPTGVSGKVWTGGDRAVDFGLAWGLWHSGYVHLHGDYLFHNMDLISVNKGKLPLYYGPGLRIRSWNDRGYWNRGRYYDHGRSRVDIGVRFPVGLAYLFDGAPVDVFLELVPTLDLVPSTGFEIDGAIGARYWFR